MPVGTFIKVCVSSPYILEARVFDKPSVARAVDDAWALAKKASISRPKSKSSAILFHGQIFQKRHFVKGSLNQQHPLRNGVCHFKLIKLLFDIYTIFILSVETEITIE